MKYLVVLSFLILSSCIHKALEAVLPSKGYEAAEVGKVKSVAIVAFDVMQFQPTGVGSKFVGALSTAQTGKNMEPVESELSREVYGYLEEQLKVQRKWKVIPLNQLVNNPVYKQISEAKKSGVKTALTANHFQQPHYIKGVLRPLNAEKLFSEEEIQKLCKALNVDGIVLAQLSYTTKRNDVTGLGLASIYLTSFLRFHLFDSANGKQVWFDQGFEGPVSDESLGRVSGMEDKSKIETLSRPMARQTVDRFLKSVQ